MALSEEQKQEIRQFLEEEREQERKKILKSVESFRIYLDTVVKICIAVKEIALLLNYFWGLFFV
ncbi:hypothetical protein [Lyngbya sp. CCY1209]|uniref:hypothetical protein n=1 Tax=Lyngbya sp. CCY1209 TaxID=2886103 RepID=UPI002D217BC8|nr:hypothetical protein [Lyngbya sp. CCY1209]MEB3886278.1 hypothetical protein [Lyngbya sp. CCY1209]